MTGIWSTTAANASDLDLDWVTIGDPGNPAFQGGPIGQLAGRGSVNYEYRLARTEITIGMWLEFLEAYNRADPFGGHSLSDGSGMENNPRTMSWRDAARFCNWLTNDKAVTPEAFEQGAYDTSTFTQNPDGTRNDQSTHSPGAKYWIPSLDEWIKGVYYDPNLNSGAGGWWNYPNGGNDPLTLGTPDSAQSNAGQSDLIPLEFLQVGSYADVQSPWGLLDASGGLTEWTEEWNWDHRSRIYKGSHFFSDLYSPYFEDHILETRHMYPEVSNFQGLRLATSIPAPGGVGVVVLFSFAATPSRRRRVHQAKPEFAIA